ncbi:GDSL-type esterase/lipase family protein [Paraglaciecola sp.]|uniref:SGNH/GDSL hydrolase family protein n=1 Tax=Paraglaciecola sp. TaxID=1920173 RepID=UPI003EF21EC2
MTKSINTLHSLFLICLVSACSITDIKPSNSIGNARLDSEHVLLTGRFEQTKPNQYSFTWPGSELAFNFEGTSTSINLVSEDKTRFQLSVDGLTRDLWVSPDKNTYQLANNLTQGKHKIRLIRLSESTAGITTLAGIPKVDGHFISPPQAKKRKILVLGDSITAGYGVEGADETCGYSLETSNALLSYASIAATKLNAELNIIAWSGIGVWRNYGEKQPSQPTIIHRHTRTLANAENSLWPTSNYQPDVIWLNIGTNDFWDGSAKGYRAAMEVLLNKLQQDYPNKTIYLIMSPMIQGEQRLAQKTILQLLESQNIKMLNLGKIEKDDGYGCHFHPNLKTQSRLGANLHKIMQHELNW